MLGVNKQSSSQIKRSSLIYAADRPHGATTPSRKGTEGLAAIRGLAFSLKSPSFFCSSLSLSLLISISSLFNWLSVKVLLSASTCPCHSKQRQLGDAAFSLLSPVSALSSALFSYFLLFRLLFIFSHVSPLPFSSSGISPLLFITPSSFLAQVFSFVSLSLRLIHFLTHLRCFRLHFLAL